MKAMASRNATCPGAAAWHPTKGGRVRRPVPAGLRLALPGVAILALGAILPAVAPVSRVGLAAISLLLVVAGGLIACRAEGVEGVVWNRNRPRSSRRPLPVHQAGAVPVGGHRVGRDARGRASGVGVGRTGACRVRDLRVRPTLPAGRHAWRDR